MAYMKFYQIISPKLLYLKCHREWSVHAKNQDRSPSKILSQNQIFCADFISGSRDFTQDLTSGVLILIHSADAFVLVMACVDCARVQQKTFSSLLNLHLLTLLLPFLSDQLGDNKTIRPFALKGHRPIAHSASPHGLLTHTPFGLRV